jgi:glycerol-3-phosphate acyltransferase PlsY
LTSFIFITGIFAVIGHCFPILFIVSLIKTRSYEIAKEHMGGKGVSTAGGILFAFNP